VQVWEAGADTDPNQSNRGSDEAFSRHSRRVLGAWWLVSLLVTAFFFSFRPNSTVVFQPLTAAVFPLPVAAATLSGPGAAATCDGRIEVDGQPFFPFGFYHVSSYGSAVRLMTDLHMIGKAGFNTLHSTYLTTHNYGTVLDEAARLGVRVLTEFREDFSRATVINQYRDKPAVLGWNIADDVDNGRYSHAQVQQLHSWARAADPRHLTYVSGYRQTDLGYPNLGSFMDVADVAAIQAYPVNRAPVKQVSIIVGNAVDAAASHRRPVIANNQTFAWPGERAPSPAEVRNMTYQSLAAGVKGIIYYTFFDGNIHLPTDEPALWAELQSLVPEINRLAPVLLNGRPTRLVANSNADTYASYWTYQNRVYVVVINTSARRAKTFSLQLPVGTVGPARPLFAGRPMGLTFADGRLSGMVRPYDVHAYVLDTVASDSPAFNGFRERR
jgi:hypothetical protein